MTARRQVLLGLATAPVAAAAGRALAEPRTLTITARLAEGATLPPDATIEVELLDVSRADAPSTRIAGQRYLLPALPAEMRLDYDAAAIDPRMTYVVSAHVLSGEAVVLRTTSAFPVLTRDASESPEIILEATGGGTPAAAAGSAAIEGIAWTATEIAGRALIAQAPPTIAFEPDGSFAMFGGCNRFRGRATIGDGRITFVEPFAGTRRLCPPDRMKLEDDIVAALQATSGYVRNGPLLSFTNDAGRVTARFSVLADQ